MPDPWPARKFTKHHFINLRADTHPHRPYNPPLHICYEIINDYSPIHISTNLGHGAGGICPLPASAIPSGVVPRCRPGAKRSGTRAGPGLARGPGPAAWTQSAGRGPRGGTGCGFCGAGGRESDAEKPGQILGMRPCAPQHGGAKISLQKIVSGGLTSAESLLPFVPPQRLALGAGGGRNRRLGDAGPGERGRKCYRRVQRKRCLDLWAWQVSLSGAPVRS